MPKYDEDISELAWCAVRYALGRMTYVSETVPRSIEKLFSKIDTRTLKLIQRDLSECNFFGMDCDFQSWNNFNLKLCIELEKRNQDENQTRP